MSAPAPELAALAARLAPYARRSLEQSRELAARLHAEELSPEHWLATLLADEGCAATRVVLHAFADPETIGVEVLALCAGIMVVGSGRTLPFSVRGVEALRAARAAAAARAGTQVTPGDLFRSAVEHLTPEQGARLAGLAARPLADLEPPLPEAAAGSPAVPESGPLFRHFSGEALQGLGASARAAAQLAREAIGPLHLLLGALEASPALRERTGLSAARVRMACAGVDQDRTPLPERRPGADASLLRLLGELSPGAETLDVLAWLLERGSPELTALLQRQKLTLALVQRCRGIYRDPEGA